MNTQRSKQATFRKHLAVVLTVAGMILTSGCSRENSEWRTASEQGAIESYQAFLVRFPDGRHAEEAASRIKELEEERDWAEAKIDRTGSAVARFLDLYPSSNHLAEAGQLVVIHSLGRDFDRVLEIVASRELGAVGGPGSVYTLGVDLPYLGEESIQSDTFGGVTFSGMALKGGAIRCLATGKAYLFGTLKITARTEGADGMTVFFRVSDKRPELDPAQTSSAELRGIVYELSAETGTWRQVTAPKM